MTIQQDIINFREDNNISESQLSNAVALRFYNASRDYLIDEIISKKRDYFYDIYTGNLINGQNEYGLPKRGEPLSSGGFADGFMSILKLSVKFKASDTKFIPIDQISLENLEEHRNQYEKTNTPFYYIADNSIFIYPTPTENVTGGYEIEGIFYPKEVTLTDEEKEILDKYQEIVFKGVLYRYYESIMKFNEADRFKIEFESKCKDTADKMSGRSQIIKRENPYNLMYR